MIRKWRPSLGLVLGGAISGTLALSLVGLITFRYLGPSIGFQDAALLIGFIIMSATAVLGWLLVRLLLRPITELRDFAMKVRDAPSEELTPPIHLGTRELQDTALRVIDMAETLRSRETSVRSFSDHVTHELKTPVAAIRAATELLQDGGSLTEQDARLVNQIAGAGDQMEQHLDAMRSVVQAREFRHVGQTTLNASAKTLTGDFPGLELKFKGGTIPFPIAKQGAEIVLSHLLSNSQDHGATRVTITAETKGAQTQLNVQDNGNGISKGNAARIFDPFFTTRREDGGTGMGLPIVQNTLRAHGADITCLPATAGAMFQITFKPAH